MTGKTVTEARMDHLTRLAGYEVLFVIAAEAEYGPALRARLDAFICGIGVVEAGVRVTAKLADLARAGRAPDLVVSLGSAGSARLEQGAVYQVSAVSWRDIDASPLGFAPGEVPLAGLPLALPLPAPLDVPQAALSTGSDFVTGGAWARVAADMVDMETYAVARACLAFGLPLLGWRGISDGSEELTRIGDWHDALPLIDRRLAGLVDGLGAVLERDGPAALAP